MVEERSFWDRLLEWLRRWNEEKFASNIEEGKRDAALLVLETAATKEQLAYRASLYKEEIAKYPDVAAKYDAAQKDMTLDTVSLTKKITDLAAGAETKILEIMNRMSPVPIAHAKASALELLAADAAFNVGVGVAGMAVEAVSAGQLDTFTDFQKFLRARTGYGGPITMLMKAPVEMALIKPLSYSLHSTFRNELPPLRDIVDMSVKGNLEATNALSGFASGIFGIGKPAATDKDIFDAIGGYEGYEQWYLDAKWNSRWRELRLGEIAWALSDSLVDDAQLDRMLGYAKYAPADRSIIIKFIKARYLRPYRDRVASQFRNEYKEGFLSAQAFRLKLAGLEIPLEVRSLMIFEADALFRLDMHADEIAAWEAQYLKTPSMTDAELRALYATIIVDPARIEPRISRMRAQRSKTPALPKPTAQGVKVTSKPSWSEIYLDGSYTGKLTPETVETSVGNHTIRIYAAWHEAYSEDVTIAAGEFVEIYAVLDPLPGAA